MILSELIKQEKLRLLQYKCEDFTNHIKRYVENYNLVSTGQKVPENITIFYMAIAKSSYEQGYIEALK